MKKLLKLLVPAISFKSYTQNIDTFSINTKATNKIHLKQRYSPFSLIIAGMFSEIHFGKSLNAEFYKERNADIPHFNTNMDNYLQFSPILLAYGFDAVGMTSKTNTLNRSVILLKSELIMSGSVSFLKYTIREVRPDSNARNSVPSGHTAQAFADAAFLSDEYGKRYKWVLYLSYSLASTVGAFRIMNNKHFLSEVLIGAGIGIQSTKISYWTHQYKWSGKKKQLSPKL